MLFVISLMHVTKTEVNSAKIQKHVSDNLIVYKTFFIYKEATEVKNNINIFPFISK